MPISYKIQLAHVDYKFGTYVFQHHPGPVGWTDLSPLEVRGSSTPLASGSCSEPHRGSLQSLQASK